MKSLGIGPIRRDRVMRAAAIVAAAWIICCIFAWVFQPSTFYRSYLFAWLFWLGVSLGAMAAVMLHHLTGGEWGVVVRRLGEHAAMTLPLLIVLFIPIGFGMKRLYVWDRAEQVAQDAILQHKQAYLNAAFFIGRAVIYFAIWLTMAWYLRSRSLVLDREPNEAVQRRLHNLSAGGMLIYFITMSFASVDWIMSREPHWFSTVFGFMLICGQAIAGLALLIVLFALLLDTPPFRDIARPDQFNDLGNLLLTIVITWTYMAFAQLLVIWMGNKQEEIPWYVQRMSNGWWWIGLILVGLHFFVPFILLLMRDVKRKAPAMLALCGWLLIMRAVDLFWLVAPSGDDPTPTLPQMLSWMDFVFPIGMGGLWLVMFLWLAKDHPLIAQGDALVLPEAERV